MTMVFTEHDQGIHRTWPGCSQRTRWCAQRTWPVFTENMTMVFTQHDQGVHREQDDVHREHDQCSQRTRPGCSQRTLSTMTLQENTSGRVQHEIQEQKEQKKQKNQEHYQRGETPWRCIFSPQHTHPHSSLISKFCTNTITKKSEQNGAPPPSPCF